MGKVKIDRRKNYLLMLDTETCPTKKGRSSLSNGVPYDTGWRITDKWGIPYAEKSYVVADSFYGMKEQMASAYYAKKIPQYEKDIAEGKRIVATFEEIKADFYRDIETYNVKAVCAHNAKFDYKVMNYANELFSNGGNFFPPNVEIWDTLKMARDTICKQKRYYQFCEKNGYLTKSGNVPATAEILYKYITRNTDFVESHTGLEDVQIETEILAHCYRQHKKMRKLLY